MSNIWLIEDSAQQLKDLQRLLTKAGHHVLAFRDTDDLLDHMNGLQNPDAIVVDLALKGTINGYQTAHAIRERRPELSPQKFCFISGWKRQFGGMTPEEFRDNDIIDKGNWRIGDLRSAIAHAVESGAV